MKKSLSLILSIALVFSMFSSLAFAADQSIGEKLKAAGVISGNSSGDLMEDQIWKREDLTVLAAKLLGVVEEAQAAGDTHGFDDVDNPYYDGFISYAKENGIFVGVSETSFGMNRGITAKQFAAVILRLLGFEFDYDTETEALAIEHGIFAEGTNWLQPAKRGDLYSALAAGIQVVGADGQTIAEKRQYAGFYEVSAEQKINSFKAVGAKKLEVKFNAKVDTDKAEISVKKGSISSNVDKVSYSDDKKTATIEMTSKLTKGDYTVTVAGVAKDDLQSTVSVEDERITKIDFPSENAPLVKGASGIDYEKIYTWIVVSNQYGENVTGSVSGLTVTAGKGSARLNSSNGTVDIDAPTGQQYILNEKVTLSAVHAASQTYATVLLTVSPPAQVSTINIKELVAKNDATLNVKSTPSDFYLVVEAKDQYGNNVPASQVGQDILVSVSNPSVVGVKTKTVGTETIGDFESKDGETILELSKAQNIPVGSDHNFGKGLVSVHMMSRTTGGQDKIDLEVVDVPKVDRLALSQPDLAVAGEPVEIPFEAFDQFGNEFTKGQDIKDGLTSYSVTGAGLTNAALEFKTDYVAKRAKIVLNATTATNTTDTQVYIMAVTATGNVEQLTITLHAPKKAEVITGIKDLNLAMGIGASFTVDTDKVLVLDQYGRTKSLNEFGSAYSAKIEANNTNVTLGANKAGSTASLVATTKGSTQFTLKLYQGSNVTDETKYISNSDKQITVRVVEAKEIASYNVGDVATIYAGGAHWQQWLSVEGVLADGTKVTLPIPSTIDLENNSIYNDYYSVTESVYGLSYSGGNLIADTPSQTPNPAKKDINDIGDGKEKSFAVIVTGNTATGPAVYGKQVVVSRVAPEITAIELHTSGIANKEADGLISIGAGSVNSSLTAAKIAADAVKLTDQYGKSWTGAKFTSVTASNFSNGKTITTVAAGDTFSIVAITANGLTIDFQVIVNE